MLNTAFQFPFPLKLGRGERLRSAKTQHDRFVSLSLIIREIMIDELE